jgi:hypothetical protein
MSAKHQPLFHVLAGSWIRKILLSLRFEIIADSFGGTFEPLTVGRYTLSFN